MYYTKENGNIIHFYREKGARFYMEKPRLHIPAKKYIGESTVVSMRLPKDMIKEFDDIAEATGRTRNEVLSMSLEFALEHMENEENEK